MVPAGKKPIRVLRIIARLNVGGPAIQAISLSSELSSKGYQTMLVCGNVDSYEGDMGYLAKDRGVKPFVIPELGREISLVNDLLSFLALLKIIKRFKPDIIHTHTAKAGTLGRLAAITMNMVSHSSKRIRIVHTFHGHAFHSYFNTIKVSIFIMIERLLAKFTDRIVVLSSLQKDDICHGFRIAKAERVRVIPLGFDLSRFRDCEKYRETTRGEYLSKESPDTFLVGMIGRLTEVKNHSLLLRAVKVLKNHGRLGHFRFLIVGDGELKSKLQNEAIRLGVRDTIVFTGWKKDLVPVYGALDAMVLTSKNEGTPVAVIEAMAGGRPVVATDVGGVQDLFKGVGKMTSHGFRLVENGILVPPENEEVLANAFLFLLESKKMFFQMAKNATNFVYKEYSLQRLLDDIMLLYDELTGNGRSNLS
jgi:glycosyltransferase involved in cell wall biosynthesis